MRFAEDIVEGMEFPCGSFRFSRDQVVDFARRWDPHPFHLDEAAVEQSLFKKLSASGLNTAAAARKQVLETVGESVALLGSPGLISMKLTRPVYVDEDVVVSHRIERIGTIDRRPCVAVAECITEGLKTSGEPVFHFRELNWIASRSLPGRFDVTDLAKDQAASASLGRLVLSAEISADPHCISSTQRIFFEDCAVGTSFVALERPTEAADLAAFQFSFDPRPQRTNARQPLDNEWQPVCFALRALHDAFWSRAAALAGSGIDRLRWVTPVRPDDRLSVRMTIVSSRRLRSNPRAGLISGDCICVNQRNETVTSFSISAFLAVRSPTGQSG